jgi:arabinose-5-phosphate isomerase
VSEGDISILISKSGSTDELVLLMPYLKKRTKIIAITSQQNSNLATNSDIHLFVPVDKEACPIEIAPTSSTTSTMALGDAIAACIMKMNNFGEVDFAKNHPLGQLGRNLNTFVKDVMHFGDAIPVVDISDDFKQALLVMTNKPMGCVCVVNGVKLVGIITDGDCRRALSNNDIISKIKLSDVMTENPITIGEDVLVGRALSIMENRKSQISVLPVTDSNKSLVGLVRIHDLIKSGR